MFLLKNILAATVVVGALASPALAYDFGRTPTPEEIALWDIDVRPDGKGLPEGNGTVMNGKTVYEQNCLACHGANGKDGIKDRLVGGEGSLASDKPIKTVGSYWPYATTLFDYIRRAMPYQTPGSLTIDDTYAVTAYILSLNGLVPEDGQLNKVALMKITMPNHDGFIPEAEFQKITNSK